MALQTMQDSAIAALPTISVVVPNFNGGATIEATLRSLIDQNYPKLEIIVVDGGSTDNSVDIIRKHESKIAWWVSEKDRGQSHAINKGFARAKGEVLNWLCSDDVLLPGALRIIGETFSSDPTLDVLAGASKFTFLNDSSMDFLWTPRQELLEIMPCTNGVPQQSCFYRRSLLKRQPILDESLHYTMDFELWNYFLQQGAKWKLIPDVLSEMFFSDSNKTSVGREKVTLEWETVYKRYVKERIPLTFWHRYLRYPLERIRFRNRSRWFAWMIYFPYQCAMIALLSPFYGYRRVRWMNWVAFG